MALIHVVAGALVNAQGQVLLARRSAGSHQGGLWEFPGGKVEAGESRRAALARELAEEIGVVVESARPLICVRHAYPGRQVLLDVWRVEGWRGEACGLEGQAVEWLHPDQFGGRQFPSADVPVLSALQLPSRYLITPEPGPHWQDFLRQLDQRLEATAITLVQFRCKHLQGPELVAAAKQVLAICTAHGARLLVNADPAVVNTCGGAGVHLTSERLMALDKRPLGTAQLVGASCHDAEQLKRAARIGADFAVLSPVNATSSHPDAVTLGWGGFAALAVDASLPVYALGGVGAINQNRAWDEGAQGVAAIKAFWNP